MLELQARTRRIEVVRVMLGNQSQVELGFVLPGVQNAGLQVVLNRKSKFFRVSFMEELHFKEKSPK